MQLYKYWSRLAMSYEPFDLAVGLDSGWTCVEVEFTVTPLTINYLSTEEKLGSVFPGSDISSLCFTIILLFPLALNLAFCILAYYAYHAWTYGHMDIIWFLAKTTYGV